MNDTFSQDHRMSITSDGSLKVSRRDNKPGKMNYCKIIPAKHVDIIVKNILSGKQWDHCSPVYPINRQEFAFLYSYAQHK